MTTLLTENLRLQYDTFKNAEQLVASYIIEHPDTVVSMSVSELAEKAGVSMATIIRLCKKVGLSGYQEMKLTLAGDIANPLKPIHSDIYDTDSPSEIATKVFESSIRALEISYNALNPELLAIAADAIIKAKHVAIYGFGNSTSIAFDLQHKLLRLGIDARAYSDLHLQIMSTASLGKDDVLIAISHSGSSKELVAQAKKAKAAGTTIISITSLGQSPLYKISNVAFCTASVEPEYSVLAFSSRVAQMVLINSLYAAIATRKPDASEILKRLEEGLTSQKY